jgi:hypothetical protein
MMERRRVIGGGVVAGVTGLLGTSAFAEATADMSAGANAPPADDGRLEAAAIDRLRAVMERQFEACELGACAHVDRLRSLQRNWLASREKYPDVIDVGIVMWERIYDWHLKHQQTPDARRLADGRYAMTFMFTTLLLRPDQPPDYVGPPYDLDGRP